VRALLLRSVLATAVLLLQGGRAEASEAASPSFTLPIESLRLVVDAPEGTADFVEGELRTRLATHAIAAVTETEVSLLVTVTAGSANVFEVFLELRTPQGALEANGPCACTGAELMDFTLEMALGLIRTANDAPPPRKTAKNDPVPPPRPIVQASHPPAPPPRLPAKIGPVGIVGATVGGLSLATMITAGVLSTRPPDARGDAGEVQTRQWRAPALSTVAIASAVFAIAATMVVLDVLDRHDKRKRLRMAALRPAARFEGP